MITPDPTDTFWTFPDIDRDFNRYSSGFKKSLSCEDGIKKAHLCLDNTFNAECVDKNTGSIKYSIDRVASCSKKSMCNSASTDSLVDKMASVSKNIGHASISTSAASLKCVGVLGVESFRLVMRSEFHQNPDGTKTLVRVHNMPYFSDSESDSE
ncbi:hypothetical protein ELAC_0269 [Estrella lausannensis]|uniref:Uncharacterized protein n=1 Tax=Estrella lausannensis TaxID=483423 RepID=A0A0H5E358_9BACT|nr:hypothetical protein ELAC_0269 [Estrella lausannensis]